MEEKRCPRITRIKRIIQIRERDYLRLEIIEFLDYEHKVFKLKVRDFIK